MVLYAFVCAECRCEATVDSFRRRAEDDRQPAKKNERPLDALLGPTGSPAVTRFGAWCALANREQLSYYESTLYFGVACAFADALPAGWFHVGPLLAHEITETEPRLSERLEFTSECVLVLPRVLDVRQDTAYLSRWQQEEGSARMAVLMDRCEPTFRNMHLLLASNKRKIRARRGPSAVHVVVWRSDDSPKTRQAKASL